MPKKILVIDDDAATRGLLKPFLVSKGFDVETAPDGEEGLAKTRSWKPDLIVLDVVMPKMDGYEFVKVIKKDDVLRKIPLIVLTAREMMRDVFVQEGVKDYVTKPYDPEELLKTVSKYL